MTGGLKLSDITRIAKECGQEFGRTRLIDVPDPLLCAESDAYLLRMIEWTDERKDDYVLVQKTMGFPPKTASEKTVRNLFTAVYKSMRGALDQKPVAEWHRELKAKQQAAETD
jgi:hypothetical protein